ncbi:MAG: hypothetical protein K5756_05190 [Clostridiales bacterium]|nr:hypothetical protein [Clostridiales bacterium]
MTKRKLIIISTILSAVVLALFVLLIVLISNQGNTDKGEKYDVGIIVKNLNEKSAAVNARNILVIAEPGSLNQGKNSHLAVKSAINNDYNGICINVAFRKDGTPVLAKNFDDVKEDSTELKKVFELLKSTDFKLIMNMGEVSDMGNISKLIDEYNVKGNVVIFADDDAKLIAIKQHLSNYRVCFQMQTEGIDFTNSDELRKKIFEVRQNGATYIALKPKFLTEELINVCTKLHMGTVVYGATTDAEVQKVLSSEIDMFITDTPNDVNRIIGSLR